MFYPIWFALNLYTLILACFLFQRCKYLVVIGITSIPVAFYAFSTSIFLSVNLFSTCYTGHCYLKKKHHKK